MQYVANAVFLVGGYCTMSTVVVVVVVVVGHGCVLYCA